MGLLDRKSGPAGAPPSRTVPILDPAYFQEIFSLLRKHGGDPDYDQVVAGITNAIYNSAAQAFATLETRAPREFADTFANYDPNDRKSADSMINFLVRRHADYNVTVTVLLDRLRRLYDQPQPTDHGQSEVAPEPTPIPSSELASPPTADSTGMSFAQIRLILNQLADEGSAHGYRVTTVLDEDDVWLASWATDTLYVMVQASYATSPPRTFLDVHAGGAYRMRPSAQLFEILSTASWRFNFGGPWARTYADGAAFGWRMRLPSDFVLEANQVDFFAFILGMIDEFGDVCNALADDLLPMCGGRPIRDTDPEAWPPLLRGSLPPDESGRPVQPSVLSYEKPGRQTTSPPAASVSPETYRCPNPKCARHGREIPSRQCPECFYSATAR